MNIEVILPLIGVALGWCLKAFSDYLVSRKADRRAFRSATFYLLKDYKALLDYDRCTSYFRQNRPSVAEFEPWRATLEARFLQESGANSPSTSTAIELLASLDPTLAIQLHNTLRNMAFAFKRDLSKVADQDEKTYADLLQTQDKLVAITLEELRNAALQVAKSAGIGQHRKVASWIAERLKGQAEFSQGMDDQKEIRNRAWTLGRDDPEK